MNTSNQKDIKIHDNISIAELFMRFICTQKIIMIRGIQITTQELIKNLHLITACLRSPLNVSHKFDRARLILFITASHAE